MKNILRLVFAAVMSALISGCSDGNTFSDEYAVSSKGHYLKLSKINFNAPAKGAGLRNEVDVTSMTTSWAFTGMDDWLSVSPSSGNDSRRVALIAEENHSGEITRTSVFKFTSTDSAYPYEQQVTVTQECTEPGLSVQENDLIFSASQNSKTIPVNTNIAYSVSKPASGADWITTSVSEDGNSLTVSVSENRTGMVRSSTIQLKGKVTCLLTVAQQAASVSGNSTETIEYPAGGGAYELNITSDVAWNSQASASWLAMTPDKGDAGTTKVRVDAAANLSVSERNGFIQVLTDDYKALLIPVHQVGLYLKADVTSLTFGCDASSSKFNVESNYTWNVLVSDSWIHVTPASGTGVAEVQVSVDENLHEEGRRGSVSVTNGVETRTIAVEQDGRFFSVSGSEASLTSKGGSHKVSISTNDEWTATVGQPSWMHISKSSGKGNIEVTLTADENASLESRTDTTEFKSANTNSKYSIITTQAGRYLTANTARLTFLYIGRELQLVVSTDGTYEAKVTEGSWLKASMDGDVVTVVAERNETDVIRVGKIVLNMTNLKSGSLSREIEVVQLPKSSIVVQQFGTDQQWELNSDGSVKIEVTGFGNDKQWDTVTGSQGNIEGETFGEDKVWD